MWVTIKEADSGSYNGFLDNEPEYMSQLRLGDPVKFGARHIIDTDIEDPTAREFEQYFKRCFVTRRIIDDGEKPRYVYREPPDEEGDSGWRFFAGDESDEYIDDPSNIAWIAVGKVLNRYRSLIEIFHETDGRWSWDEPSASWQRITD